jgi:hypothetical protein
MKTLILLVLVAVVLASGATEAADKAIFEFLGLTERPFLKWLGRVLIKASYLSTM